MGQQVSEDFKIVVSGVVEEQRPLSHANRTKVREATSEIDYIVNRSFLASKTFRPTTENIRRLEKCLESLREVLDDET
jgi:hypothetical protein